MLEEHTRTALKQRFWTIIVNDVNLILHRVSFIVLWKTYANGIAIMLSVQDEEGQLVMYTEVGHAASGTSRTESGRFSTLHAAVHQLIQACNEWDSTWDW